jgi:hypothetical protein
MLRKSILPFLMLSAVLCAGRAQAQNVLMNSAETINPGNFKIAAFPTILFGKDVDGVEGENETGIAGRFGYGFTDRFDMEFESVDDVDDSSFTRAYVVPGIEYKITQDLDLVAEFGIGLNDDSPHYLSAGLAFYIR